MNRHIKLRNQVIDQLSILVIGIFLVSMGCASQIISLNKYRNVWLGQKIIEIQQMVNRSTSYASSIGWKETTYSLNNGDWVYVEPLGESGKLLGGGECFIHWQVNPEGIIVGSHTEGEGCKWL